MESIYKKKTEKNVFKRRVHEINSRTIKVDKHLLFKDGLNFNFLYHLFLQKVQDLLNGMEGLDENDFNREIAILDYSISKIEKYVIE